MKAILTVVFVTSIFTLFDRSATAMEPNEWHTASYRKNWDLWIQAVQRKVRERPKYAEFQRLVGAGSVQLASQLGEKGNLLDPKVFTSSKSDEIDQAAVLLLRHCTSLPYPPDGSAYQKKMLITLTQSQISVDFVPFNYRAGVPRFQ
jgi:outer membrane biosynthesis protein TonB